MEEKNKNQEANKNMIKLTARDIGLLKLKDFCPRCFWFRIKYPIEDAHTFRFPMPGIVSIMDSYIKQLISQYFRQNKILPDWFQDALRESGFINPTEIKYISPSKRWKVKIETYELTGIPDALFQMEDDSFLIADYKTASFTSAQEELFPLYEAQLNAYKYLAEHENLKVKALSLIYMEPIRYKDDIDYLLKISKEKLTLHFRCMTKFVKIWENREVEELVKEAGKILSSASPPEGNPECKYCKGFNEWLNNLIDLI